MEHRLAVACADHHIRLYSVQAQEDGLLPADALPVRDLTLSDYVNDLAYVASEGTHYLAACSGLFLVDSFACGALRSAQTLHHAVFTMLKPGTAVCICVYPALQ